MVHFTFVSTFGFLFATTAIAAQTPEKFMVAFSQNSNPKHDDLSIVNSWERTFNNVRSNPVWKKTGYTGWLKNEGDNWGWISGDPTKKMDYAGVSKILKDIGYQQGTLDSGDIRWGPA
ncbi:hypothetical protein PpBr36_04826 [Pyricularia pennisetigena]|uniref:hypothetical protein n=1 Tax=Pyricularia pennisetigena TaxID=1578925 RepID=UPI001154D27D|nr:hypothetical protein PpBr36_04826 [Pyricularia pennisetigena]TLS26761.1 hypothetical protein PpBr36_04826 [Pyricularia pennisetigena]